MERRTTSISGETCRVLVHYSVMVCQQSRPQRSRYSLSMNCSSAQSNKSKGVVTKGKWTLEVVIILARISYLYIDTKTKTPAIFIIMLALISAESKSMQSVLCKTEVDKGTRV